MELKNAEWCSPFGKAIGGASCFNYPHGEKTRDLDEATWQQAIQAAPYVCTETKSFAEMKAVIEKLCHDTGRCTEEAKQMMRVFFARVEEVGK